MAPAEPRTPEQIRAEIGAERAELASSVAALKTAAAGSARLAASGLAGLAGLVLVARLRSRRRR